MMWIERILVYDAGTARYPYPCAIIIGPSKHEANTYLKTEICGKNEEELENEINKLIKEFGGRVEVISREEYDKLLRGEVPPRP